jgi:hypothetical protein
LSKGSSFPLHLRLTRAGASTRGTDAVLLSICSWERIECQAAFAGGTSRTHHNRTSRFSSPSSAFNNVRPADQQSLRTTVPVQVPVILLRFSSLVRSLECHSTRRRRAEGPMLDKSLVRCLFCAVRPLLTHLHLPCTEQYFLLRGSTRNGLRSMPKRLGWFPRSWLG